MVGWVLEFLILKPAKMISGQVPTSESMHLRQFDWYWTGTEDTNIVMSNIYIYICKFPLKTSEGVYPHVRPRPRSRPHPQSIQ